MRGMRRAVDVGVEQADAAGRAPLAASARLTAVVDLPTPPLPLATATMCLTPGTEPALPPRAAGPRGAAASLRAAARSAMRGQHRRHRQHARQDLAPRCSAALRNGSSAPARRGSISIAKPTLPSLHDHARSPCRARRCRPCRRARRRRGAPRLCWPRSARPCLNSPGSAQYGLGQAPVAPCQSADI